MEDELDVQIVQRHRSHFKCFSVDTPHQPNSETMVLNEAFSAEKDVSSASRQRIEADGNMLGVMKSSGMITATGTGSTGWLYSSRYVYPSKFKAVQDLMGSEVDTGVNELLAKKISD